MSAPKSIPEPKNNNCSVWKNVRVGRFLLELAIILVAVTLAFATIANRVNGHQETLTGHQQLLKEHTNSIHQIEMNNTALHKDVTYIRETVDSILKRLEGQSGDHSD